MFSDDERDVHQVLGWLTLVLQRGPRYDGVLADAGGVAFEIFTGRQRDQYLRRIGDWSGPLVALKWLGGPLAGTVAGALAALPDPQYPITIQNPKDGDSAVADVTIGPVWLLLHAAEPRPDVPAPRPGDPWRWPLPPLATDGAARAVVLWLQDPTPDTALAAVLQLPPHLEPADGYLMADTDWDRPGWFSPSGSDPHLDLSLTVRLRTAAGVNLDAARTYAQDQASRLGTEPGVAAVRMVAPGRDTGTGPADEQVFLHVWHGLHEPSRRFLATLLDHSPTRPIPHTGEGWDTRPYPPHRIIEQYRVEQGWSSLAAAVRAAAIDWPRTVPARLAVRPLGLYSGAQYLYQLEHLGDVPPPYPLPQS